MKCANCGQRSDWTGRSGEWSPVHDRARTIRALYRCERCGHRQRKR